MEFQLRENSISTALLRDTRRLSQIESRQAKNYVSVRKSVNQAIAQREQEMLRVEGVT